MKRFIALFSMMCMLCISTYAQKFHTSYIGNAYIEMNKFDTLVLNEVEIHNLINSNPGDMIPGNKRVPYWHVDYFVDDFGKQTNNSYLYTITTGYFSNSATSRSDLRVKIIVKQGDIGIFLYEYSWDSQAEKFIREGRLLARNESDKTIDIPITRYWSQSGGLATNSKELFQLIKFSKTIDFVIRDGYSSEYHFTIHGLIQD